MRRPPANEEERLGNGDDGLARGREVWRGRERLQGVGGAPRRRGFGEREREVGRGWRMWDGGSCSRFLCRFYVIILQSVSRKVLFLLGDFFVRLAFSCGKLDFLLDFNRLRKRCLP